MATDVDRLYTPAWLALGNSYSSIGDHEQAQSCYARIIRHIDDQCIPALVAMASEYLRVNKPLLASPYLSMAVAVEPDNPDVLNELGVMFYVRGDLKMALEAFHRGRAQLPDRWNPRRITIESNILHTTAKLLIQDGRLASLRELLATASSQDHHLDGLSASLLRITSLLLPSQEATALRSRAINMLARRTPSNRFRPLLQGVLGEQLGNNTPRHFT